VHTHHIPDQLPAGESGYASLPLASPFIVVLRGRVQDAARVGLVLTYAPGGDLYTYVRRRTSGKLTVEETRFFAVELVDALAFLHEHGVAYRDLKPENVLIDGEGHVVLTDFGFARLEDDNGRCFTRLGTPHYQAPELLDKRNKSGYTKAVDWWALGCLVYELIVGSPCFGKSDDNPYEIFLRIMSGKPPQLPRAAPQDARSFVRQLLAPDASKRLAAAQAVRDHPWFGDVDWVAVRERRMRPPFVPTLTTDADTRYFDRLTSDDTAYVDGRKKQERWRRAKSQKSVFNVLTGGGDGKAGGGEETPRDEPFVPKDGKDPFAEF